MDSGRIKKFFPELIAACCLLLCFCCAAGAEEKINDFLVELRVGEDASLLVTENITVTAEDTKIKHGIFRSVPTLTWHGRTLRRYGVELVDVRMDGSSVPCRTETGDLMTSFIIGDPDTVLSRGEHEFTLVYRTTGHIRRSGDGLAIHYNATGNQWSFPIEAAAVVLVLPDGAEMTNSSAYITRGRGPKATCEMDDPNVFVAPQRMAPGEALAIRASWHGGAVSLPDPDWRERLGRHAPLLMTAAGIIPLLAFAVLWFLFRRVRRPVVIPLFSAPKDLSPGLAAHIFETEENAGRADLLWTAVRGFMHMKKEGGTWHFLPAWPKRKTGGWQDEACLAIADGLFSAGPGIEAQVPENGIPEGWSGTDSTDGRRLSHALEARLSGYRKRMKDFVSPGWPLPVAGFLADAALLYAAMYVSGWVGIYDGENLRDHLFGLYCFSLVAMLPMAFLRLKKSILKKIILFFFCSVSLLLLGWAVDWQPLFLLPALSCIFTPLIFWLLFPRRRTPEGLHARAQVDGLAMYINMAEKDRLSYAGAPGDTVEKYEEILPYAVALGMAETWEKRFAPVLAAAHYAADWMNEGLPDAPGDGMSSPGIGDSSYETALAAVSAAAAAYGASQADHGGSGFDGGSSGGDGGDSGGGGGGGW